MRRSKKDRRHGSQMGFALAAVLWLLAGLVLVATLLAELAVSASTQAAQVRARSDFVAKAVGVRAELQYWLKLATPQAAGFTYAGYTLYADGRPYDFGDGLKVRVQDHFGYISLASINRLLLQRFLRACGVEADQTDRMLDALEDYVDADNLQRLNGAEADEYRRLNRVPPRNAEFASAEEVWDVLGWSEQRDVLAAAGCADVFTMTSNASFQAASPNPATAPRVVLTGLGMADAEISAVLEARVVDPDAGARAAAARVGSTDNMFGVRMGGQVGGVVDVEITQTGQPFAARFNLHLLKDEPTRPTATTDWRIGVHSSQSARAPLVPAGNAATRGRPTELTGASALTPTIPERVWVMRSAAWAASAAVAGQR